MATPAHVPIPADDRKLTFPFQLDILTPSQYDDMLRTQVLQPEKSLMLAVLGSAIADYLKDACAEDQRGKDRFERARDWFESNDERWPHSFMNICAVFGWDADCLRAGIAERLGRARNGERVSYEKVRRAAGFHVHVIVPRAYRHRVVP